jgi:quercetin dioxygenase-like cupin family protein
MNEMTTVSRVLTILKERGYTEDFNLTDTCLVCHGNSLRLFPDEFVVDKHYRFEGPSDPGDEAIVYAISSIKHDVKGVLVNAYGMYSDRVSDDMIKALKENYTIHPSSTPDVGDQSDRQEVSNQATELRPEGDRVLDAQLVVMDLNTASEQIKNEKAWKEGDRNAITLFKSDGMRLVLIALHAGAEMRTHTAPGIISVQVLEGTITFQTELQAVRLTKSQLLTLHKEIPHSVLAEEDSTFLLTLSTQVPDKQ